MRAFRAALFEHDPLRARQETERLLQTGAPIHELLADLYVAAAHARSQVDAFENLILIHNLDHCVAELTRLERLQVVADVCAGRTASCETTPPEPPIESVEPPASFRQAVRDQVVDGVAAHYLSLEDPRHESTSLRELVHDALDDPTGRRMIHLEAFRRGFERVGRDDRIQLALRAARHRIGTDAAAREPRPAPPPLPADASAGLLLAALREFHAPRARAAFLALAAHDRSEETLTILVQRAEEHAGPRFEHLMLAFATSRLAPDLDPKTRSRSLELLLERLLERDPAPPHPTFADEPAPARNARERNATGRRLVDALARRDPDEALDAAARLLADPDGADFVRQGLIDVSIRPDDGASPRLLNLVLTCLALAEGSVDGRRALSGAVYAVAGNRETEPNQ